MMRKDRSKLLIPCYRDMDPYDLPEQLSVLMSYDMGRIGFMQDLIRGVDKVLSAEKKKDVPSVKETIIIKQSELEAKTTAALDRGMMAIEDGKWDKAQEYLEQVLSVDARNGRVFWGLFLLEEKCQTGEEYIARACTPVEAETKKLPEASAYIQKSLKRFDKKNEAYRNNLQKLYQFEVSYSSRAEGQKKKAEEALAAFDQNHNFLRALKYATGITKSELERFQAEFKRHIKESVEQAEQEEQKEREKAAEQYAVLLKEADRKAEVIYKEQSSNEKLSTIAAIIAIALCAIFVLCALSSQFFVPRSKYKIAEKLMETKQYEEAIVAFEELDDYRDSQAKAAEAANARVVAMREKLSTSLAAGGTHTVAITSNGTVIATKYNGDTADYHGQCNVAAWENTISIAAGMSHTVGLRTDGTVTAVGWNKQGQCNTSKWNDIIAIAAGYAHTVGLKEDGTVVAVGNNTYGQCNVSDWKDIAAIAAGSINTIGIKSDGTVVAAGLTSLLDMSAWTRIVSVATGGYLHSEGLRSDGSVVSTGWDEGNQHEMNTWSNIKSISSGHSHLVGLKTDGTVVAVGRNNEGQCDVSDWTDIVAISAGVLHTAGLKADGTVVAVGQSDEGQCDVSDWVDIRIPEK